MTDTKFDFAIENERSISDKVCETIRRAIISQVFSPDERLVEAKIAKNLNVSITPVRHAFAQLANEGLLVVYPFKGTYVISITKKFIDDVLFTRKTLETAAANLAFKNITQDDCKTLLYYSEESERLFFEEKNLFESVKYDLEFHTLFFERSNNGPLMEMWDMLKNRIQYI